MNGVPLFWPGVALVIPLTLLCARPIARALHTSPWRGWLLGFTVAVILVATLTPIHRRLGLDPSLLGTCDLSRTRLASLADIGRVSDISLNIALFIPLGLAIALLPSSTLRLWIAVAAVCAPFVIETMQMLLPALARGCQSGDVIDNLTGLVIGLTAGSFVAWVASRLVHRRR
jgi:glycopeptide antibiotics resistance protein